MLTLIIALLLQQVTSSDFQCPASNNLIVQDDYGVQYVVSCGTDADPGAYASNGAYNSWNDCFEACSTHSIDANGAGGPCNGFTYAGALNGRGGGTCYFKSGNMRFVGSGSGLISVATPERCPGCNIAGYANGTSPRSSSAAAVQTVSVTYTTIQTRTETATRYSTNTITTTGTVTTTAVSSYVTTAITTAVSTSRETLTTTTVQTTTQPASTVTSVSTYSIDNRANTDSTDYNPRDQRSTRSYTDYYFDPTHDLCLDIHDLLSIYDDVARCNRHYCFLGDIDHEDHNRFHYDNYYPGDSDSAWHDHSGDNTTAWRNSRVNLGPNRFRTYGHPHYSQHQLRRRVCDLCDPNSPTSCPVVDEQTIVDCASGSQYNVNCDISYEGIVFDSVTASGLLSCLDLCSPVFNCQAVAYNIETQICSQYEESSGNPIYSPNTQFATLIQRVNADDGAFGAESISEPDPTSVSSDMGPSEATQSSQFSGEQSFAPTIASSTSVLEPSSISSETSASAFVQSGQTSSDSAFTQITSGERTSSSIYWAPSSTFSFATSVSSSLTIVTATSSTAPTETPSTSSASSGVPSGSASSSWSTSESILPTATGIPSCSTQGEQSTYTDPSTGSVYVVQCNKEYQGVVERSIYKPDVEQCVTDCSTNARCIGVGYDTQEEICNEYSAFAPTSGNYSQKIVFAKMRARAVVYDGGSTTTVPISTSYVPLTAVTTPLPPSMAGSASVSILSTSLSSSSSSSLTSTQEAVLTTSSSTSNAGTGQPASSLTTPAATKSLSESYSSHPAIQTPSSGPTNSLTATQYASSETTVPTWTTARATSEITLSSSSEVSGPSSKTGATMLSSTNTGVASQSVSAPELSLMETPTSPLSASGASATFSSLRTSSTNDTATTSLTVASPTRTLEPSATVCPDYDGTAAVDENGVVYYVQCGVAYNGTVINPSSQKRQAIAGYTMLQCTDMCDQNEDCVGLTLGSDGRCTQYSYVSGYLPDQAPVAAVPLARAPSLPTDISVAATSTNALSSSFTFDITSSQTDVSSLGVSTVVDVATISPAQASTGTHTSSARALTDNNISTRSPAQAPTRTSGINTSTFSNLTSSPAAPTKSTSPPPIVTIFVTPSTCTASHSVYFSTTTTYTTVTIGAQS
ncbi:hypothetical protein KC349_g2632 [Hortaea werneckii]|nr:hypothetical protein KC349_g2632 [Hortaea werneckii]